MIEERWATAVAAGTTVFTRHPYESNCTRA
jgi:hypothetical protein